MGRQVYVKRFDARTKVQRMVRADVLAENAPLGTIRLKVHGEQGVVNLPKAETTPISALHGVRRGGLPVPVSQPAAHSLSSRFA